VIYNDAWMEVNEIKDAIERLEEKKLEDYL